MTKKTLDEIWQDYLDNAQPSPQSIKDLAWHIENDSNPMSAMSMACDCELKQLANVIAKQLDNPNDQFREWAVGCLLGRFQATEYAEKGLKLAQEDLKNNVRAAAINYLGCVIFYISSNHLKKKIAIYLLDLINNNLEEKMYREAAYDSILYAMNVPFKGRPDFIKGINFDKDVDESIIEQFKKEYLKK